MTSPALPSAAQQFIDATSAEDRASLVAAFARNGTVDDFGRIFTGADAIGTWSDRENIGTHNRITVRGVTERADVTTADIAVSGDGYNGPGTFAFHFDEDGLIQDLIVRG